MESLVVGRWFLCVLLLNYCCNVSCSTFEFDSELSDVWELDETNFDYMISGHDFVFVEFYAPWCGHCKKFAPLFYSLATHFKESIPFAMVDATAEKALAERYDVSGFPKVVLFSFQNITEEYIGDRTAEAIIAWIEEKTKPTKVVSSQQELTDLLSEKRILAVVKLKPDSVGLRKTIKRVETDIGEHVFMVETPLSEGNTEEVEILSETDKTVNRFPLKERTTAAEIKRFILFKTFSLITEINKNTYNKLLKTETPFLIFFLDENEETQQQWKSTLESWAKHFSGQLLFAWGLGSVHKKALQRLGATGEVVPLPVVIPLPRRHPIVWPEDKPVVADNVLEWLQGILAGQVKSWRKSLPPPTSNESPLVEVVGSTFESVVFGNLEHGKDVLLEFYDPDCEYCKKLDSVFQELAYALESVDSIVVARINAVENGYPDDLEIRAFPTILFYRHLNKDSPVEYQVTSRSNTVTDFVSFVQEHASVSFQLLRDLMRDIPSIRKDL